MVCNFREEWDGLALIERNGVKYINEPHAGGGNPVFAIGGKDTEATETIFTDMLGTSIGKVEENGYSAIDKTSFGADTSDKSSFFTGKPYVEGLGYAFLFRNYRADMGKWLTQDLIGYPDGWNNFAYCGNSVIISVDLFGCVTINSFFEALDFYSKNKNPNANATIGNSILNELFSTDNYTSYYNGIKSQAENVSQNKTSGQIGSATPVNWIQGLVLGRTSSRTADKLSWTASDWSASSETQESRTINVSGTLTFTTEDDWDFKSHASDPWYVNLVEEVIPGGIATVYSYISQQQGGTPYHLSGSIEKTINFSVIQYRLKPNYEE